MRDAIVRHGIAFGFLGAGLFVAAGIAVVPKLRRDAAGFFRWLRRSAAESGRMLGRAWVNSPLRRQPPTYYFASHPDMRAAYRRDMDRNRRVTRADRRWLRRELRGLDRIVALYSDSEEAQR